MSATQNSPKGCKDCHGEALAKSPSGEHLICPKCGCITLLEIYRPPRGLSPLLGIPTDLIQGVLKAHQRINRGGGRRRGPGRPANMQSEA